MCLLAGVTGLLFVGGPVDILAQIGFFVFVGLAAKNAILIVEFARQTEEQGSNPAAAVFAACTRFRPILMTSLAFILGVVPLAIAEGAGAEMRRSLGTAVFFGMLRVTVFGLLFKPTFYAVVRSVGCKCSTAAPAAAPRSYRTFRTITQSDKGARIAHTVFFVSHRRACPRMRASDQSKRSWCVADVARCPTQVAKEAGAKVFGTARAADLERVRALSAESASRSHSSSVMVT
jgi:hypothetical protein